MKTFGSAETSHGEHTAMTEGTGGPMSPASWRRGEFQISTDVERLDLNVIHRFLSQQSEWAKGIPRATFEASVRNSLCFGLFHRNKQIGFARAISDRATVAYLGDVFVLPEYRGKGLATWLMECVVSHPELQHLRRWILITENAHGLYRKLEFKQLVRPETYMEIHNPDVYKNCASVSAASTAEQSRIGRAAPKGALEFE